MSCKQYYTDINGVTYSLSYMSMNSIASYAFSAGRPFLPVAILDVNNNNQIDFTNSKNFPEYYGQIMEDCLTASYNFLNGITAAPKYTAGEFGEYLSQHIGVKNDIPRYNRFKEIKNFIGQFWRNYTVMVDYADNLTKFSNLMEQIKNLTDKKNWIAPGDYFVDAGNATDTTTTAIKTANPTWPTVNVLILELDSIG